MIALRAPWLLAFLTAISLPGATLTGFCTTPTLVFTSTTPQALGSLVCPQFDPSLGTLTSIDVRAGTWSASGLTLWKNTAQSTLSGPFAFGIGFFFGPVPGGAVNGTFSIPVPAPGTLLAGETSVLAVVPHPIAHPGFHEDGAPAPLLGTGTFQLPVTSMTGDAVGSVLLLDYSVTASAAANSASVTFNFTPVPEASSATLALAALLYPLSRWRRGRRSAAGSSR